MPSQVFRFVLIAALIGVSGISMAQMDSTDYLQGKFEPRVHPDFSEIPAELASRKKMFLRKDVIQAFNRMHKAAAREGIPLRIISATRSFDHQKRIWEGKWNGATQVDGRSLKTSFPYPAERAREILRYSSMPGTSRHHWGTDFDINSLSPSHFSSGQGKQTYEWLRENAHRFGFCQAYTPKGIDRKYGYEEEPWHWSYFPVSCELLRHYQRLVSKSDISGFEGADALPFEEVMQYVEGVASECR